MLSDNDAHIKRTPKPPSTVSISFEDTTKMSAPSRGTCQSDLAVDQKKERKRDRDRKRGTEKRATSERKKANSQKQKHKTNEQKGT